MYNSKIVLFEKYTPNTFLTNDDISKFVDTSDEWINSRTGISKRHISKEEDTSVLACKVAKSLMEKANLSPEQIDLIIIATITPDYLTPSTACIVQGILQAKNAIAFDVNAACSGFIYGLSVADKFLKTGTVKNAIVIGAEVISKVLDWNDRGTCVLFGDGAGGVLLQASTTENSILAEDLKSDGNFWEAIKGLKIPLNNPLTKEQTCQDDNFLKMNGRDVFNFATKTVYQNILDLLEKSNITMEEVKYIVPHQANIRIFEVMAKKLKISMEKFYVNLQNFGNTSSASIPIAIAEMFEKNLLQKDDKIILTGFGGGLTWGSILINI